MSSEKVEYPFILFDDSTKWDWTSVPVFVEGVRVTTHGDGGGWPPAEPDDESNWTYFGEKRINIGLLLMQVNVKTRSDMFNTQEVIINNRQAKIDFNNAEAARQMEQQAAEMAEAKKSGKVGEIFGYVATALICVAAVITMNPVLLATAVVSVGMLIATETGGMDALVEEVGLEAFIVIMVVLAIIMMGAPWMFASAGGTAAVAGASAGRAARAAAFAERCSSQYQAAGAAANAAAGFATVGSGAAKIDSSRHAYKAQVTLALVTRTFADVEFTQGQLQDMLEIIVDTLERFSIVFEMSREIMDQNAETRFWIASKA